MPQARITDLAVASTLLGGELLEVSQLSTTVAYSAITISAQASDNSFNDSAAQFIAEGFAVADRVKVIGFTGNVANNIVVGTITALTAGKMTIGGTDGDVIVDDAAGESVTIAKWTSRQATAQDIADLAAGGGGNPPFRPSFFFEEVLDTGERYGKYVATSEITFPANFAGSEGHCETNPALTYVIDVKKNATTVGTVSISTSGVFTFATVGGTAVVFAIGDRLTVLGPASAGTVISGCDFTLEGEFT